MSPYWCASNYWVLASLEFMTRLLVIYDPKKYTHLWLIDYTDSIAFFFFQSSLLTKEIYFKKTCSIHLIFDPFHNIQHSISMEMNFFCWLFCHNTLLCFKWTISQGLNKTTFFQAGNYFQSDSTQLLQIRKDYLCNAHFERVSFFRDVFL